MHITAPIKSPTPQLTEVKANFEKWRLVRPKKSKIPNNLWQQVLALRNKYSISEISTTLGLSGSQIKNKIKQFSKNPTVDAKSLDFIAINIPPNIPETIQHSVGKIEIKRADGSIISIEHLGNNVFTQILTQFMRGL